MDAKTCNGLREVAYPSAVFKACADSHLIGVFNEGGAKDVVEVQVGTEQILDLKVVLFDELVKSSFLLIPGCPF